MIPRVIPSTRASTARSGMNQPTGTGAQRRWPYGSRNRPGSTGRSDRSIPTPSAPARWRTIAPPTSRQSPVRNPFSRDPEHPRLQPRIQSQQHRGVDQHRASTARLCAPDRLLIAYHQGVGQLVLETDRRPDSRGTIRVANPVDVATDRSQRRFQDLEESIVQADDASGPRMRLRDRQGQPEIAVVDHTRAPRQASQHRNSSSPTPLEIHIGGVLGVTQDHDGIPPRERERATRAGRRPLQHPALERQIICWGPAASLVYFERVHAVQHSLDQN
jgi:hypothetical protein